MNEIDGALGRYGAQPGGFALGGTFDFDLLPLSTPGVVAYWPMYETGGVAIDYVARKDGTLHGPPLYNDAFKYLGEGCVHLLPLSTAAPTVNNPGFEFSGGWVQTTSTNGYIDYQYLPPNGSSQPFPGGSTTDPHSGGFCAVLGSFTSGVNGGAQYNTFLDQTVTIPIAGVYQVSCWVRNINSNGLGGGATLMATGSYGSVGTVATCYTFGDGVYGDPTVFPGTQVRPADGWVQLVSPAAYFPAGPATLTVVYAGNGGGDSIAFDDVTVTNAQVTGYMQSSGSAINLADGTIEFWTFITQNAAVGSGDKALLCGLCDPTTAAKYDHAFYLDNAGTLHFDCQNSSGTVTGVTKTNFPFNQWVHVVGVTNSTNNTLYVNGVGGTPVSFSGSRSDFSVAGNFYVGGGPPAGTFIAQPGTYNQVAVYSTPAASSLSAQQVSDRYNSGLLYLLSSKTQITNVSAETLLSGQPNSRVTLVAGEALVSAIPHARLTNVSAEALVSRAIGYSASTTVHATVSGAASATVDRVQAASSRFAATGAATTATTSPDTQTPVSIARFSSVASVARTAAVSATSVLHVSAPAVAGRLFSRSATSAMALTGSVSPAIVKSVADVARFSGVAVGYIGKTYTRFATDSLNIGYDQAAGRDTSSRVFVTARAKFADSAIGFGPRAWSVSAQSYLAVATLGSEGVGHQRSSTASDRFATTVTITTNHDAGKSSPAAYRFGDLALAGRDVSVAATSAVHLSPAGGGPRFYPESATGSLRVSGAASEVKSNPSATERLGLSGVAGGHTSIAGSSSNPGPGTLLAAGFSGKYPMSFAECPSGLVLFADGIDSMARWDTTGTCSLAGLLPPATAITLAGTGVGCIVGRRVAFVRFLDADGNVSNLAPVSNAVDMGRDATIESITFDPATRYPTIRSTGHALTSGEEVIIGGVDGISNLAGTQTVNVLDADTFSVAVPCTGSYDGNGWWAWGVATVVYQGVATTSDPRVVRRQILRNLDGDSNTMYVDIDTTDLTTTTFESVADEETLSAGDSVLLFFDDGLPAAIRFAPPPNHKSVVASHLGRIFATADVIYSDGSCSVAYGSPYVQGYGTEWRATFVGRRFSVAGGTNEYEIAGLDESTQLILLTTPFADASDKFSAYAIQPAPAERRLVYYSEPTLPEAWPPWNAVALPDDSDIITGLMVKGSYLFVLERRHIYRMIFQDDPSSGLSALATMRGALNNRCWVLVEDTAFMLDETGIHAFDGQKSTAISQPIQVIFQQDATEPGLQVDWSADQTLWHAAHDPVRDTIRWFLACVGDNGQILHAVCYDYRLKRWWVEAYPLPMTASCVATVGYRRSLVGTVGRQVVCLSEGTLDGIDAQAGLQGLATAADSYSVTDSTASFPSGLGGVPVSIIAGTGVGQQAIIASNNATTLDIVQPWAINPDTTSVYQIGGIPWSWRSGWFRYAMDEADNPRDTEVVFSPLQNPAFLNVEHYYDHGSSPNLWGYSDSRDGVATTSGSSLVSIDLTKPNGFASFHLTGHREGYAEGVRYVSVNLSGVQGTELVRVFTVGLNGAEQES